MDEVLEGIMILDTEVLVEQTGWKIGSQILDSMEILMGNSGAEQQIEDSTCRLMGREIINRISEDTMR